MRLLLDTQAFLWFIGGNAALSSNARSLIEDVGNDKLVSLASIWEMAIKTSLGKLPLAKPFAELIPEQLQINGFGLLNISVEHAVRVSQLPFHHRDPFDRLIAAQCLVENLAVLSNDEALDAYGIKRLW